MICNTNANPQHDCVHPPIAALLIDDDDVDRERLVRMLRRIHDNIHISEAASKQDAIAMLHDGDLQFTFIFLDFKLNDGDGRDLLPEIWQTVGNECCVVAVTGSGTEQSAANAIKLGIHDYLSKGDLSAEKLAAAISEGMRLIAQNKLLRETEKKLLHRSLHDPLTDLPNRHLFFDRLDQQCAAFRRDTAPFAVMMLDLDRFKQINDAHGHAQGDHVLVESAHRLKNALREVDTIARLGGDEFAVLLPGMHSAQDVQALGEKLLAALAKPVTIGQELLSLGCSIGIALCPLHGCESTALIKHADDAMYQAKRGISKVCLYANDAAVPNNFPDKRAMVSAIQQALQNSHIQWHWQPKMDLDTQQLLGFELLARWPRAQHANISTANFIEAIEDTSLIFEFTRATVQAALQHAHRLRHLLGNAQIALNVSARVLEQHAFVEELIGAIKASDIPPHNFVFELTETALISNPIQAQKVVELLSANGIPLSIDDFGAGFTSFSYLRDFHVSEIKVDKSYILDICGSDFNQSLVRSLVVFCDALGIRLVAEGVENEQCRHLLLQCGCHFGQGYGLARPMPPEKVNEWIAAHTPPRLH
ncbi:EAL domain-containing protein [Curvibacter sp. CHRR-16]|uniref:putative bifunctional diguanylate cyclase/phosphodiesterase n=1 Tax=Curvibacter sp. CHRR-16 TaxID=2835872 RepID=UPI001BDAC4D4|nr:GGDEF domain-containing response regulator [Curvibacter sp. CHRR-16]MBT0571765.1 EAL domain-containing protein [Curvibacter sp. CHRR-16]